MKTGTLRAPAGAPSGVVPLDDRGSALIAVTMVGLVAVLAVSSLAGRAVAEHRAVEDSLAQVRLYWAAMGHGAYLLSRIKQSGPCGTPSPGTCDDAKNELVLGGTRMLDEVTALRTWQYPEVGAAYRFTVVPMLTKVADDLNQPVKGRWQVGFSFARPSGAPNALRTAARTPALELRYCLINQPTGPCSSAGIDNGVQAHHVTSLHRGARPAN